MITLLRSSIIAAVVGLTIASTPALAAAALKHFQAVLNSGQETPPTGTAGFGVGYLTYDTATATLCYSITSASLGSAEIVAHIHGPAAPGVPGGIVLPLPPGASKAGCVVAPPAPFDKKDLFKNLYYINIHTTGFPGGEIRGQILRIK
jgi:hypothetical protein